MSDYQGNIVIKNPAVPTGPAATGRAPGMWKLSEVAYWIKQGVWPNPAIVPDQYFPYVSLLLSTSSLSNANNNLFVDSSGAFNPASRSGNITQGSFSPYSTNWSNYFDGTGDEVLAPNAAANFGSSNFTAECWVMFTTNTIGYQLVMGNQGAGDQQGGWIIYTESNNRIYFAYSTNGSSWAGFIDTGVTPTVGVWTHLAVVRNGSTFTFYVNGVASGTPSTNSSAIANPSGSFRIGRYPYFPGGARTITAWISNVRLVNGTAVYTSNFTPSTSPLTAISGTSLLTCQSNRFRDASSNNWTITVGGNPSVQDFSPFASSTYTGITYNQSDITNWSGYFDGSGDWLACPSSSAFAFGTGDYTLEGWFYTGATGTERRIFYFTDDRNNVDVTSSNTIIMYDGAVRTFGTPTLNAWNHFAVSRASGTVRCYLNGVLGYSGSETSNTATRTLNIGATPAGNGPFNGYLSNLRVVKGTAVYTGASLTVPTTPLTAISGTSLLTCQDAAFTDNSTNNFILTQNGNVTVAGNSPFNTVGYWSNYFDGTGDNLSISNFSSSALSFGTGDFTIEFWARPASSPNNNWSPFFTMGGSGGGQEIRLSQNINGTGWGWLYPNNSNNGDVYSGYGTLPINTWSHIAMTRSGGTMRLFLNGAVVATGTGVSFNFTNTTLLRVAMPQPAYADGTYNGHISNLRIVKGTALYTSAFTPSTTPLTAVSGTGLLTCQASRLIDSSANAFALTVNGDVSVQSFDPFYTSTTTSNGGSMYLDGNGDHLAFAQSPLFNIGAADASVEMWIYSFNTNNVSLNGQNGGPYSTIRLLQYGGFYAFTINNDTVRSTGVSITTNCWVHLVVTITGGVARMFVNGVLQFYATGFGSVNTNAYPYYIGGEEGIADWLTGYITDFRFNNGAIPTAYQTSSTSTGTTVFTPPTAPLTPTPSTVLLVNGMNAGIYDATTINDMETKGDARVRNFLGNYYAGSFDGSGDYLSTATSAAIALGTSDFTFECWVNPTAYPNDATLVYAGNTSTGNEISLQIRNGQVASHLYISGSHSDVQFTDLPVTLNTWSHLAISRVSGVLYGFLNGVRSSVTTALTANFGSSAAAYVAVGDRFAGSLSNARMTKNAAIYSTATYTVPTSPLSATSNTAFLTCQNLTFTDNSPNALAITVNGGATAGATGPFTYTRGNSVYFDGTGDQLFSPVDGRQYGNFTIECWIYLNAISGYPTFYAIGNESGGRISFQVTGGALQYNIYGGGNVSLGGTLGLNQWYHIAFVRSGTTITGYVNGTSTGTAVMSGTIGNANGVYISGISSGGDLINGYVDDLRVTTGIARYTSNFTPPTQPFPTY